MVPDHYAQVCQVCLRAVKAFLFLIPSGNGPAGACAGILSLHGMALRASGQTEMFLPLTFNTSGVVI